MSGDSVNPEPRRFDLADLLSITTGRLLSHATPHPIDGVYRLLGFMVGESLMTHQLPRAADACEPELLRQHPWLADVKPPADISRTELFTWLTGMERTHGMRHLVIAGATGWRSRDALAELDQIAGTRPVITVDPSRGPSDV